MNYLYASVVRLTMDDPRNDSLEEGDVMIVSGKHEDGYSYTVVDEEKRGFTDVECEVLRTVESPYRMGKQEIRSWAAEHLTEEGYEPGSGQEAGA